MIVAVSITLSYYISYDIPELISGIEKWYKLFSDLSIGVIINFIFYVFQVYIPRREEEKATLRIIDPDLTKICQGIQEILLVAQTYLPGFEKGKIHIAESSVYYMKMTTADAGEGWTRHFDLYKDFSQLKKGVVETTDRLLSSALLQGCDKEVVELLGKLQRNGFLQALEAAENNKFDPDCYYTDFENCYSDFCAIFEGLKSYVSEYKVQYIRPLTLADIGNVKKCAVGKHPKSEKHGNTAQFSEVERSGTQENCGGIGSGCRLRLRPLPVLRRRQSQRVARIDPNAVVVDKNIAKNDRFDLFSRQLVRRDLIDLLFLERGEKALHPCVVEAMSGAAETLYHAAARQLGTKG